MRRRGSASWSVLFGLCIVCVVVRADLYLEKFGCETSNPVFTTGISKLKDICFDKEFTYKLTKTDAENFTSYVLSVYLSYAAVVPKPGLENNQYFKDSSIQLTKIEVSQNGVSSPSQTFDLSAETIDGTKIDRCGKALLLATLVANDATFNSPRVLMVKDPDGFSSEVQELEIACKDEKADVSISFASVPDHVDDTSYLTSISPGPILPQIGTDAVVLVKNEGLEAFPARTRISGLFAAAYLRPIDFAMRKNLYMWLNEDPGNVPLHEIKEAIRKEDAEMLAFQFGDSLISTSNLISMGAKGSSELKPGEEIVIDANKIELPKDISVCNEAVLIVAVFCAMGCPDIDISNNFGFIPVNVKCEVYPKNEDPLMCEVYPNWNSLGNNAWLSTQTDIYMNVKVAQYQDESWIPLAAGSKPSAMENRKVALTNAIINMEANDKQVKGMCLSDLLLDDSSRGSLQQIAFTIQSLVDMINMELESLIPKSDSITAEEIKQLQTIAKTIREMMRIFINAKGKEMNMFTYPIRMMFRTSKEKYDDDSGRHNCGHGYDDFDEDDGYNDGRDHGDYNYGYYEEDDYEYRSGGRGDGEYRNNDNEWKDRGDGGRKPPKKHRDEYGYTTEYPNYRYDDGFIGYDYTTENPYDESRYSPYGRDPSPTRPSRFKRQSSYESGTSEIRFPDIPHYPGNEYGYPMNAQYVLMNQFEKVVKGLERALAGNIPKYILPRRISEELSKYLNAILYSKPYDGDMFNMVDAEAEMQLRALMLMVLKRHIPANFIYAVLMIIDAAQISVSENIGSFRVPVESEDINNVFIDITKTAKNNVETFQKLAAESPDNFTEGLLLHMENRIKGMELLVEVLTVLQKPEIITGVTKVFSLIQGDIFAGDTDCLIYGETQEVDAEDTCKISLAFTFFMLDSEEKEEKNKKQYSTPVFWKKENNNVIKKGEYCSLTGYYHWRPAAVCSCNSRVCKLPKSGKREKDDDYGGYGDYDDGYGSYNGSEEHSRWDRDIESVDRQMVRKKRQANKDKDRIDYENDRNLNDDDSESGGMEGLDRGTDNQRKGMESNGGENRDKGKDRNIHKSWGQPPRRRLNSGISKNYGQNRGTSNGRRRDSDFQESMLKNTREQSGLSFNELEETIYRNNMRRKGDDRREEEGNRNNKRRNGWGSARRGSGKGGRRKGGSDDRGGYRGKEFVDSNGRRKNENDDRNSRNSGSNGNEQRGYDGNRFEDKGGERGNGKNREFSSRRNQADGNGFRRKNQGEQRGYHEDDNQRRKPQERRQNGFNERNGEEKTNGGDNSRRKLNNKNNGPSSGRSRGDKGIRIKLLPTKELTTVGNFTTNGTLAVKVRNAIGLACASSWTQNNTRVACSQILRRHSSQSSFEVPKNENIDFGMLGPVPIMLGSLQCSGEEKALQFCDNPVWDEESCNSSESVAILCG